MNIVLIGMRGSGKSTVAKMLAKKLGRKYMELDDEIAKKAGARISEVVEQQGWNYFRVREAEVVEEAAAVDNTVISTGGGVVLQSKNVQALKKNGICIFLSAPIEELLPRIGESSTRPRLTGAKTMKEELEKVWEERKPLYEKAADETIDTTGMKPKDIAEEIVQRLKKKHIVQI
ncbi:MAG: shikimate kinase [Parcubacteria group bacterium Gr01-1014_8]|nr:MAG: shikimate kinase [Parcubacteria group bacterium Gr01-1014_8]